ncbi:nuclear transport factor 2 family protein [Pseudomonas sp. R5(2019)]|uniref:nuclear transport factor 2 family protein n=1 Tax=Pseudomonas sp. R5(2019) TaxID=2697566 RepID=UPI001412AF0B|nr:nuclear transport factor 2 family protein [Pseudomonas sp. R5(2019)]NBA94844.1 nuclear transport factor 2 family protein [Pseudomonas sp. R5(2019)]
MSDFSQLTERLQRLEAVEAIRQLKARYAALADAKYTADYRQREPERLSELAKAQAACFTSQAVWHGAEFGGDRVGREALAQWFEQSPWCFAAHYYVGADIEVDGQQARAAWRLWQLALRADNAEAVLLMARTEETYQYSEAEGWLIDSMRFCDVQVAALGNGSLPLAPGLEALRARTLSPMRTAH